MQVPSELVQAFIDISHDVFTQLVRDGKINPASQAASISEFENQFMAEYKGNDVIKHTTLRIALRWLENYINTEVDLVNSEAITNLKFITPTPTLTPADGEIQAIAEPLVLSGAGTLPEVPAIATLKPGQVGFDFSKHILKGQLVLNETDNKWYYRKGDTIIDLKEGLELAISHITGLSEWKEGVDLSLSQIEILINEILEAQDVLEVSYEQYFSLSSIIEPNYNQNPNSVKFGAGLLSHFGLKTGFKQWTISETSQSLPSSNTLYYIYAKCLKVGDTGILLANELQLANDDTHFHFLVGMILPVINGLRTISITSGVPIFNLSQIKLGKWISPDGLSSIDLQTGVFIGKFTFLSGSSGIENVLTIGGRNLVRNSIFKLSTTSWAALGNHTLAYDAVNTFNGLGTLRIVSSGIGNATNNVNTNVTMITPAKDYTLTFWAKADTQINVTANINGAVSEGNPLLITTSWAKYKVKLVSNSNLNLQFILSATGAINITQVKFEQGNVPTDWTEAPEDIAASQQVLQDYVDTVLAGVQEQMDRQIEAYNDDYAPTLLNEPASLWLDDATKNLHLGDLFFNSTTGLAYRFSKTAGVYGWVEDESAAAALALAQVAKDTADGKRRIFTAQPADSDVYDAGDMWVNATFESTYNNVILRATTHKNAGVAFSINHWTLASNYTDDTAANNAQATADAKSKNFTGVGADVPNPNSNPLNYKVGDTWQDGINLKICVSILRDLARDFVVRTNYDSTIVTIQNGVVTAGSIRVKDSNDVEWAGMRGATGIDGNEVGIWAGASMVNRNSAPFRVTHNGFLHAEKGDIAGWTIGQSALFKDGAAEADSCGMSPVDWPFYAGSKYVSRATASFRVAKDGSFYANKGQIAGWTVNSDGIYKDIEESGCGLWSSNLATASVCLYAGAINAERTNAPFRVKFDGSVYMSKATLQSATIEAGVFRSATTGKRVMINESDRADIVVYTPTTDGYVRMQSVNGNAEEPNFYAYQNGSEGLLSHTRMRIGTYNNTDNPYFAVTALATYLSVFMKGLPAVGALQGLKPIYQQPTTGQFYRGN
jgi:hypothetical protein